MYVLSSHVLHMYLVQAEPLMKEYVAGVVENSGKFVLMYGLIEECLAVGDKVLIFRYVED